MESVRAMLTSGWFAASLAALMALSFAIHAFRGTSTLSRFALPTLTM